MINDEIFFARLEAVLKNLVAARDTLHDIIKNQNPEDMMDIKGGIDTLDSAIHIITTAFE